MDHIKTKLESQTDREEALPERCDLCGAPMISLHCKITCLRCGYKRDCSDP